VPAARRCISAAAPSTSRPHGRARQLCASSESFRHRAAKALPAEIVRRGAPALLSPVKGWEVTVLGIRQTLNDNPIPAAIGTGFIIVAALTFVFVRSCSSGAEPMRGTGSTKAYFTTDDGKTYFIDDVANIPPYKVNKPGDPNNGKRAVRARVARCKGGQPFVAVLEMYTDYDKTRLEQILKQQRDKANRLPRDYMSGVYAMLKKPLTGEAGWMPFSVNNVQQWAALAVPTCPDGSKAEVVEP
jgi:hypothetical protein